MPLPHVLWIGGPPGTGKTSIARRIAAAHDLRVYHADAHTWAHHDLAVARGLPATEQWERMTPDERWVMTPPERMAEHSLDMNADRFRLMLEDIRAFPDSPLIVVEGTPLLPWLAAPLLESRMHAVWLLPTPDFERDLLAARPTTSFDATSEPTRAAENRIQRELRVARAIERGANELGLRTLRIDGTRDLAAMERAVLKSFADAIARGPRAATGEARSALRRDENGSLLRQILTYLERVPEAGRPADVEYPFACECGRSGCREVVETAISEYARLENASQPLTHFTHRSE